MKFGVLQFPGSCDEVDALGAAGLRGRRRAAVARRARPARAPTRSSSRAGFSYGDYLRAGAIARFSPAMESVIEFASEGGLVLGICNGFQVLCEARLLPGALLGNANRRFTFRQVALEVVNAETPFTRACARGRAAEHSRQALVGALLRRAGDAARRWRTAGRWCCATRAAQNFNGSVNDIAGVCNEAGNVFGLMPHPEHAVDELTAARPTG